MLAFGLGGALVTVSDRETSKKGGQVHFLRAGTAKQRHREFLILKRVLDTCTHESFELRDNCEMQIREVRAYAQAASLPNVIGAADYLDLG